MTEQKTKILLDEEDARFAEKLIKDNSKQIKAVICSALGKENQHLAEDAISEVYLLICKKINTLKNHTCPKAWILVAARHTAQNIIRKYKNDLKTVSLDEIISKATENDVFEEAIFSIWIEDKVPEKLIAKLTDREQEIYRKIYKEDKTPKEIADELNISVSSVRNIHKNLKDKIKDYINRKDF